MIFVSTLSGAERQALRAMTRQAVGRVAERAWYVLWSAEQVSVPEIAARMQRKPGAVRKWLRRYQQDGIDGLHDRPRSGRPTRRSPGLEQAVFRQVNQPPWNFGYVFAIWTVRTLRPASGDALSAASLALAGAANPARLALSISPPESLSAWGRPGKRGHSPTDRAEDRSGCRRNRRAGGRRNRHSTVSDPAPDVDANGRTD